MSNWLVKRSPFDQLVVKTVTALGVALFGPPSCHQIGQHRPLLLDQVGSCARQVPDCAREALGPVIYSIWGRLVAFLCTCV